MLDPIAAADLSRHELRVHAQVDVGRAEPQRLAQRILDRGPLRVVVGADAQEAGQLGQHLARRRVAQDRAQAGRPGVAPRRAIGVDQDPSRGGARSRTPRFDLAGDLHDRAGDVDAPRAGLDAVEDRPAAPHAVRVGHDLEPLLGARSRLSKMNRWALTIAAGPTYSGLAQNDGQAVVQAAHRMHLLVSSNRSRSAGDWRRSLPSAGSSSLTRYGIT